jgi:DNA-binding transcriptional MerR regulator
MLNRSGPTIRNWAREFAEYLSPTGAPQEGKPREFTPDDMAVFDLVAKMKDQNKTYEEIHATLKSGMRGNPPDFDAETLAEITASAGKRQVDLEVQALQQVVMDLKNRLAAAQEQASLVEQVKLENRELQTSLRHIETDKEDLRKRLDTVLERVETLSKQLGEEYVRGVMDTLQRMGQFPAGQGNHQEKES